MEYEHITHAFTPVYDENSRILILGTLPSVASRENNFYYGHRRNRFWKLLAHLLNEPLPSCCHLPARQTRHGHLKDCAEPGNRLRLTIEQLSAYIVKKRNIKRRISRIIKTVRYNK